MSETTNTTEEQEYDGELPYTVEFKYPVKVGKETTLSSLTFTEIPDAMAMSKMPMNGEGVLEDLYPIMAAMCKTPEIQVRKIKWHDIKKCMPVVTYFLAE